MNARNRFRLFGSAIGWLAVGLVVLGMAWIANDAWARGPFGSDQSPAANGQNNGNNNNNNNDSRPTGHDRTPTPAPVVQHEAPPTFNRPAASAGASTPAPTFVPPAAPRIIANEQNNTNFAPAMRTVRDSAPHFAANDQTPGSNQQPKGTSNDRSNSNDRPNPPEPRRRGGDDSGGSTPSGANTRRETPPAPAKDIAPVPTRSRGNAADVDAGERTTPSDLRRQVTTEKGKVDAAGSGTPTTERRIDAGKRTETIAPVESGSTTTPASSEGRTGISDVRKRLNSKQQGDSSSTSGRRDTDATSTQQQPLKEGHENHDKVVVPEAGRATHPSGHVDSAIPALHEHAAGKARFVEQVKSGELAHLTTGETAQKIKLADQYRMSQQGDVARRLGLEKHAVGLAEHGPVHHAVPAELMLYHDHHPHFYYGLISPAYATHCLKYHYWGPTFFAGLCWYPTWSPWVDWSWHLHCNPYWDPRPIWCRPVVYDPCPGWTYWDVPTWTPLPEVSCGTWVDLKPPAEPVAADLQLVAVRFVDPGHPEEALGPRYRVWFRNVGNQPITHSFNVVLLAGNDPRPAADMPQAGVRVTAIEAGDTQSVDIRLPAAVYKLNPNAEGDRPPFSVLHVMVDANQEIPEITRANNGARLNPAEILPVDPASFELEPTVAHAGGEILLAGEGFGPQPGQVLLHIGGKEVECEVAGWYDLGVRWKVPNIVVIEPVQAEVIVVRGDGAAANPLRINIAP